MATRKKKIEVADTTVVKGNHLTVTTDTDGKTTLEWDDEALAREVRDAIEAYELTQMKPAVRAKVATRKKKSD
jgi:YD repeat-containing protein